eukprot:CAMPEP_0185510118 /NCGR_PEP_ID=MMETSP1366-20130426/48510_1 /TAXON_ID=38817 /ORGANISM="Gephyrocapsa oceanica, Strain RCC1303" /LENGTH=70 /DNA_ID=CAMNT_0028120599 /DNA_START=414 /DNA_END=626 /DNA_ORIENTATION=+
MVAHSAPTGVHPSLAGRPDWGGHRRDGGHGRPRARRGGGGAFLQGEEYEVVGGAATSCKNEWCPSPLDRT